jgi:hypothetical protein
LATNDTHHLKPIIFRPGDPTPYPERSTGNPKDFDRVKSGATMANASCSDLRALFLPTLGKLYSSKVDQAIGTLAFAISALCQLLLVMVTCSNSMAMASEMCLHHGDADELNRELSILHRRLRSVLGYHFIKQIAHYTIAQISNNPQ